MVRRGHTWLITSALALCIAPATFAQIPQIAPPPVGLSHIIPFTGELSSFGDLPPSVPSTWVVPNTYLRYPVLRPFYVPVPVASPRPMLEPIRVDLITLRPSAPLQDLRIQRGTVVAWVNTDRRDHNLLLEPLSPSGSAIWASRHTGQMRPNSTLSLAFHQPDTYVYFLQDQPDRRGRITVE
jgi:hypothetical protein